jgi:catechol 2,3-dioxygenase-like lactoylglutathione lyase family enzyme
VPSAAGNRSVSAFPQVSLVLWSTDIPAMVTFLRAVAGMDLVEEFPGFARLHAGNAIIDLHSDDDADRRHPWYNAIRREGVARGIGAELRVRVESVDAAYQAAIDVGAIAIQLPVEANDSYQATVMGPDGYLFTLWER